MWNPFSVLASNLFGKGRDAFTSVPQASSVKEILPNPRVREVQQHQFQLWSCWDCSGNMMIPTFRPKYLVLINAGLLALFFLIFVQLGFQDPQKSRNLCPPISPLLGIVRHISTIK